MERSEVSIPFSAATPPAIVAAAPLGAATAARREPELIRICLVCGAELEDRACKLICRCGYFLSCSDYL